MCSKGNLPLEVAHPAKMGGGGHNLPPLVRIELTDLTKPGGHCALNGVLRRLFPGNQDFAVK